MCFSENALSAKYQVRKLTTEDVTSIYELCKGNPIFFHYCPPAVTRESILDDMKALPPRTVSEDKYYIGFFSAGELTAIMDLILHFPKQEAAYIGLFMVERKAQGTGVGSGIIRECLSYLKMQGFYSVHLAYAKGNGQSESFWQKNGFVKTGTETNHGNYISVSMKKMLS